MWPGPLHGARVGPPRACSERYEGVDQTPNTGRNFAVIIEKYSNNLDLATFTILNICTNVCCICSMLRMYYRHSTEFKYIFFITRTYMHPTSTGNKRFGSWAYILFEKNQQDFLLSHISLSIINSDHDVFCLVTNKSFKTGPLLTTSNWSKDWACWEHRAGKLMKSIKIYVLRSKLLIVLKFHKFKWLSILERRQNIWIWDQQRARAWAAEILNM